MWQLPFSILLPLRLNVAYMRVTLQRCKSAWQCHLKNDVVIRSPRFISSSQINLVLSLLLPPLSRKAWDMKVDTQGQYPSMNLKALSQISIQRLEAEVFARQHLYTSLVPRPLPAFHCYRTEVTESWAGPGNEAIYIAHLQWLVQNHYIWVPPRMSTWRYLTSLYNKSKSFTTHKCWWWQSPRNRGYMCVN